jgi:hypothetical protein
MSNGTVNVAGLNRLIWFLNLDRETLQTFNRDTKPSNGRDNMDREMAHRYLFWNTGDDDNSQTLINLQQDIKDDLKGLLDPGRPASEALQKILDRLDEIKFTGFRKVLTLEEQIAREKKEESFAIITLVRVSPPAEGQKGRRKPIMENLAVGEGRYDFSARENFYRVLDDAIRNNAISEIRCCLNCGKFFRREGSRLTYCSNNKRCETEYNNKRRIEAGYYKNRPEPPPRDNNLKATKDTPTAAKKGYNVFLEFRNLLSKGSKASKDERLQRDFIQQWTNLDVERAARRFMEECKQLDPDKHWRKLERTQKARFESFPR